MPCTREKLETRQVLTEKGSGFLYKGQVRQEEYCLDRHPSLMVLMVDFRIGELSYISCKI